MDNSGEKGLKVPGILPQKALDECNFCMRLKKWMLLALILIIGFAYFLVHRSCMLPYSCSTKQEADSIDENDTLLEVPLEYRNPGKYKPKAKILLSFRDFPSNLFFIVLIASSSADPKGESLRNAIRRTWGNCKGKDLETHLIGRKLISLSKSERNNDIIEYKDCRIVFNLGITNNEDMDRNIRLEAAKYGDIIVSDVVENYRNMTLKLRAGLAAIAGLGAKYIVKADNDVYINLLKLAQFLVTDPNLPRTIYGGVTYTGEVVRDRKHRHYVLLEDYPKDKYPVFCKGSMIVLSGHALIPAVKVFSHIKPFNIDDAYLGIVFNKLGIKPVRIDRIVQFQFLPVVLSHLHLCDYSYLIGIGDSMKANDMYKVHELMKSSTFMPSWMCWHFGLPGFIVSFSGVMFVCFWYVKSTRRKRNN